jgi:hypothetical protein
MNIIQNPKKLTDEEIMSKHLALMKMNRARVAKFYENNRDAIKAQRKARYAANKLLVDEAKQRLQPNTLTLTAKKTSISSNDPTLNEVLEMLKNDKSIKKLHTLNGYLSGARMLFLTGGCKGLISCLRNYEDLSEKIENSRDPTTGLKYADNTLMMRFQSILYFMDQKYRHLISDDEYKIMHPFYKKKHSYYKILSNHRTEQNKLKEVPSFEEYLERVIAQYGVNSKENLVASLFSVVTARTNDYSKMKVINSLNDDDETHNFIVIDGDKPIHLIFNEFKTDNRYIKFQFKFTSAHEWLATLIKNWVSNKKKGNNFLIERGGDLSKFINNLTRSIGFETEPSLYRHMRAAELASQTTLTPEQRAKKIIELSEQMMHSPMTHKSYARILKKINK